MYIFELSLGVTEPPLLSLFVLVSLVLGSSARPPEAPGLSVPHLRQQQHPTPPYTGRGSSQFQTETDEGRGQRAGQEIILAGDGDRLDSMTKDNER